MTTSEVSDGPAVRLGTRGSPLALRQAAWVSARLAERGVTAELVTIQTTGDRIQDRPLYDVGGKGLFLKEIEEAIVAAVVDGGVHSMKDLPGALPDGLGIAAVPVREDPRDVLISKTAGGLADLSPRARVGTGSLRRAALVKIARPDVSIVSIRGNVETRLRKWRDGEVDAIVLAAAGLKRLGLEVPEAHPLEPEEFPPAIGQGALALEAAVGSRGWQVLAELDDPDARDASTAERGLLAAIGGDCRTPIAAFASLRGDRLRLCATIASPDGERVSRGELEGSRRDGDRIGRELGDDLLARGGRAILEELST